MHDSRGVFRGEVLICHNNAFIQIRFNVSYSDMLKAESCNLVPGLIHLYAGAVKKYALKSNS